MKPIIDPEGLRLPIKLDTASNGEFEPVPLSPANHAGNRRARAAATENARRLGMSRRGFLVSACGAASTLLAFNAANAAVGKLGGFFELEPEAALEPRLAQARVGGKGEFIFDVQGHFVDPTGAWVKAAPPDAFKWSPKAGCALAGKPGARSHLNCLGPEEFVKDVFLDSDTDMMVLSFIPSTRRDPRSCRFRRPMRFVRSSIGWKEQSGFCCMVESIRISRAMSMTWRNWQREMEGIGYQVLYGMGPGWAKASTLPMTSESG